jgi:hypothetical protein
MKRIATLATGIRVMGVVCLFGLSAPTAEGQLVFDLELTGMEQATVSDGDDLDNVVARDESFLRMTGGTISDLFVQDLASALLEGGRIFTQVAPQGSAHILFLGFCNSAFQDQLRLFVS